MASISLGITTLFAGTLVGQTLPPCFETDRCYITEQNCAPVNSTRRYCESIRIAHPTVTKN